MNDDMNKILGIGEEFSFSNDLKKTLRIGTVKQLKEVGELYKDGLIRPKAAVYRGDEEQIKKWVEILNIIVIEGFTREEFDDSLPEQVEAAVERFLLG